MLGTNDANKEKWNAAQYELDYAAFVNELVNRYGRVYVMIPPPIYNASRSLNQTVINELMEPIIRRVAKVEGIPDSRVISIFEAMGGKSLTMGDCFSDYCHPNDKGYRVLSEAVYNALSTDGLFNQSQNQVTVNNVDILPEFTSAIGHFEFGSWEKFGNDIG
jgi:lysophospholipase L1-like esterase